MLITFEGLDFSGKSTQVRLLADWLESRGRRALVLREPGGTEIGERIRSILLDRTNMHLTQAGELFLFSASRAQLVEDVIRPALADGVTVILDRYFDSTTAYQGYGRGIPLDVIHAVNRFATRGLTPDRTFFLDIPLEEIERRIRESGAARDRMEASGDDFYRRVRNGFLALAAIESRFIVVDGTRAVAAIHEEIIRTIEGV